MADFLSDPWFDELNARLSASSPGALPEGARPCRVVFEMTGVPEGLVPALTLWVSADALGVAPGSDAGADAFVRLDFPDAAALAGGHLDSATALRDGRIKVRGDVNAIVPLANWLLEVLGD